MINTNLYKNKLDIIIISGFLIFLLVGIYYFLGSSRNGKTNFIDIYDNNQYYLNVQGCKNVNNPYFAKDIYIVPGQGKLAHNINTVKYDNSYLPYEGAVPAVDVLRANNKILPPSYYTQVIRHNTTPYSAPVVLSK